MNGWFDNVVAWIGAHPIAAGLVIFAIVLCDSLLILGAAVPVIPLLFGVGVLISLGEISGPYAVLCAALGAFVGDASSYWVGYRWGPKLRGVWPFARYPQLLDRGEALFRRNAVKSVLVARFVGAIRPFVPAVAGMLHMPLRRYVPASLLASLLWAMLFLAPGWLLGHAYDAVAAVANRLALVLGALLAALVLMWAAVLVIYRWFAGHADSLLARALRWTRAHPRLGRYAAALIDPNRPESASLAILAVCLLAMGVAWFVLLGTVVMGNNEPLALDRAVFETMLALRNPLADRLMAGLASIGDAMVLVPAIALTLLWLLWRRRWIAAVHWLAALAFGLVLTALLGAVVDMPNPPTAPRGFGFPSIAVTMTTIGFGFFAILIARELPGRQRVWPYVVSGAVVALLGFARLYFGAHWLSDVVGGMLFGIVWLLILGIAYRRHVARSFWMQPPAWIFYAAFLLAALWHAPRSVDQVLARFAPGAPRVVLDAGAWWSKDWATLPAQREREANQRWPLDLQVAGPLEPLQRRLQANGWGVQPQAGWLETLHLLDDDTPPELQPVLPATLDAEAEVLLMRRPGKDARETKVLRLWRAPARLRDGTPLWMGSTQTLRYAEPFGLFGLWLPQPATANAPGGVHDEVRAALRDLRAVQAPHPATGMPVLRLRIDADQDSSASN
ncbi:bifunctional DedA family/phosphatase PAP2 family protein [Luteimonas aquatica]|uniref:bifunctional DedA family/phosphatase PAP2 family protein n=1 Tax=Luteimonas aquatica TaxID=450364 RepID=UPI001F592F28|nr:VTT domain-containing protein [Luteimonas aquatica]